MKGHWSRTCRTPEHFVKLYQASTKGKNKNVETNLTLHNNEAEANDVQANLKPIDDVFADLNDIINLEGAKDTTHLDIADFF